MKTFFSLVITVAIISCSQKEQYSSEHSYVNIPEIYIKKSAPEISTNNDTIFHKAKKYSGHLYELYPNLKDTIFISSYFNGLQSGIEIKWYMNKQIMEIRGYRNGQKNGKQTAFWENGNKKFEFVAKNDIYEGEMKEWNIEGRLIHLANYKNGQENGTQKMWYESGKIKANYVVMDGKRYGLLGTKNCRNVSDIFFNHK